MTLSELSWMISQCNMKIGCGCKYNNLYLLISINSEGKVNVAESLDSNLWHGQLNQMSHDGLDWLMAIGYILKLQKKTDFCKHFRSEIDPKSTLSQLRDEMTTPRTCPHRYLWVDARKINRRLSALHHLCWWLYMEGLGLFSDVQNYNTPGLLSVTSASGEPIRTPSEDNPIPQWRWIHLPSLQKVPNQQRDSALKDCSIYPHAK